MTKREMEWVLTENWGMAGSLLNVWMKSLDTHEHENQSKGQTRSSARWTSSHLKTCSSWGEPPVAGSPAPGAVPGSVKKSVSASKNHTRVKRNKMFKRTKGGLIFTQYPHDYIYSENILTSLAVALGGSMRSIMMLLGLWFWSESVR